MPNPAPLEVWLRGPLPHVPPLLQPVAHALLQVREELATALHGFPPALLNERPAGLASVGFHLQHMAGVLDRLLTYARGEALTAGQLATLAAETEADAERRTESMTVPVVVFVLGLMLFVAFGAANAIGAPGS